MKKYLLLALILMLPLSANASPKDIIESVKQKNVPLLLELLAKGEDVNGKNEQGNTALHYAVALNDADITRALLSFGADANIENSKGWTPLKIAEAKKADNVIPLLTKALEAQNTEQPSQPENKPAEVVTEVAQVSTETPNEQVEVTSVETSQVQENTSAEAAKNQEQEPEMVPLEEAKNIVLQQMELTEEALSAQKEAEDKIKLLEAKIAELEKEKAANDGNKEDNKAKADNTPKSEVKTEKVETKAVSKLSDKIYAGDEEIVYCLNYLGQGEERHLLQAAGFFAASANISEQRYNEIIATSNDYLSHVSDENLKSLDESCSKVITPQDAKKQNQIIQSMNKSLGL